MKSRVNVYCPACRWYTSRAPKPDQDYGTCRCGRRLELLRARRYFAGALPPPAPVTHHDQYATWPELVAAELDRIEREAGR